jgi:hypothetical protein
MMRYYHKSMTYCSKKSHTVFYHCYHIVTIVSLRCVRIIYEVVMKSLYYFVREIVTFIIMIVDVAKVRATAGQ